jgi:hypothetical protein
VFWIFLQVLYRIVFWTDDGCAAKSNHNQGTRALIDGVPRPSATDPETLVRFADYRISRVCQPRQAGSLLKERSAIVRAICLMTLLTQSRTRRVRSRSYFAPEPASRTRPTQSTAAAVRWVFNASIVGAH